MSYNDGSKQKESYSDNSKQKVSYNDSSNSEDVIQWQLKTEDVLQWQLKIRKSSGNFRGCLSEIGGYALSNHDSEYPNIAWT